MKNHIIHIIKQLRWKAVYVFCIFSILSILSGSVIATDDAALRLLMSYPSQGQEFKIDVKHMSMPQIELKADLNVEIDDAEYRFVVGNPENGRALEYEDAPAGYEHPSIIDSGWIDSPQWIIDFGSDFYGGHVTHVTIAVRKDGRILESKTIKRDFYITGDKVSQEEQFAYIESLVQYHENIREMAKAISIQESHGSHFWQEGVSGRASHDLYPLRENNGGGYGMMQLTSPEFISRGTIWSWKKNIDVAVDYIDKCFEKAVAYLHSHPGTISQEMIFLEAYNRYNGGLNDRYHWWSTGRHPKVGKGWIKFSYISVGKANEGYRDYNNDGKIDPAGNPWNIPPRPDTGYVVGGPNQIARRAARYADKVIRIARVINE